MAEMEAKQFSLKDAIVTGLKLREKEKYDEAEKLFRQITEQLPDQAAAWLGLGQTLLDKSEASDAIIAFEHAMKSMPATGAMHHALGSAKLLVGRTYEAEAHYREAIEREPTRTEYYFNYSRTKRFTESDGVHVMIEERLNTDELQQQDRCNLHFAAGKIFDDIGLYNKAFDHFCRANEAKDADFDVQNWRELVDSSITLFDRPMLERIRAQPRSTIEVVFIVGMPRSGTTLVEQILSSHSEVFGAGELTDLNVISEELVKHAGNMKMFPHCIPDVDPTTILGLGNYYMQRIAEMTDSQVRFYCDKSPNNFVFVGLMHALFPNVRVIHCRRHPLDTLFSCYMTNFKSGQEYSYSFDNLAEYYHGYHRMMNHWQEVTGIPILAVDYESVVADQQSESRRMIEFLGLNWEDGCLQFQKNARVVKTASNWQVRQPIYRNAIDRWKHYSKHLQPLSKALNQRGIDV